MTYEESRSFIMSNTKGNNRTSKDFRSWILYALDLRFGIKRGMPSIGKEKRIKWANYVKKIEEIIPIRPIIDQNINDKTDEELNVDYKLVLISQAEKALKKLELEVDKLKTNQIPMHLLDKYDMPMHINVKEDYSYTESCKTLAAQFAPIIVEQVNTSKMTVLRCKFQEKREFFCDVECDGQIIENKKIVSKYLTKLEEPLKQKIESMLTPEIINSLKDYNKDVHELNIDGDIMYIGLHIGNIERVCVFPKINETITSKTKKEIKQIDDIVHRRIKKSRIVQKDHPDVVVFKNQTENEIKEKEKSIKNYKEIVKEKNKWILTKKTFSVKVNKSLTSIQTINKFEALELYTPAYKALVKQGSLINTTAIKANKRQKIANPDVKYIKQVPKVILNNEKQRIKTFKTQINCREPLTEKMHELIKDSLFERNNRKYMLLDLKSINKALNKNYLTRHDVIGNKQLRKEIVGRIKRVGLKDDDMQLIKMS